MGEDSVTNKEPDNGQQSGNGQKDEGYNAHRPFLDYHFWSNPEMEFAFQWILGSIPMGGCEVGEAFYVAKQVEQLQLNKEGKVCIVEAGTAEKWQQEWLAMARRKEVAAEKALAAGHRVSARKNFLKASNYYRTAVVSMLPETEKQLFDATADTCRAVFKKAGALFDPPLEFIEIPFTGEDGQPALMPGFFQRVDTSGVPRQTLIMIGGGETFYEDLYFYIAPAARERGFNLLTLDIPGQGLMPRDGHYFRKDTENQMRPVVDWACNHPEIDNCRLGMYGISNGGYFVTRAAMHDTRIKAIVVSNAVIDNYLMFSQMPFASKTQEEIEQEWSDFQIRVVTAVAWRFNTGIKGQVEKTRGFVVNPEEIYCHVLDLVSCGEDHGEAGRQQKVFMDKLPRLKNLIQERVNSPRDEGAVSHCIGENRTYMSDTVFDWLEKVFG